MSSDPCQQFVRIDCNFWYIQEYFLCSPLASMPIWLMRYWICNTSSCDLCYIPSIFISGPNINIDNNILLNYLTLKPFQSLYTLNYTKSIENCFSKQNHQLQVYLLVYPTEPFTKKFICISSWKLSASCLSHHC